MGLSIFKEQKIQLTFKLPWINNKHHYRGTPSQSELVFSSRDHFRPIRGQYRGTPFLRLGGEGKANCEEIALSSLNVTKIAQIHQEKLKSQTSGKKGKSQEIKRLI